MTLLELRKKTQNKQLREVANTIYHMFKLLNDVNISYTLFFEIEDDELVCKVHCNREDFRFAVCWCRTVSAIKWAWRNFERVLEKHYVQV